MEQPSAHSKQRRPEHVDAWDSKDFHSIMQRERPLMNRCPALLDHHQKVQALYKTFLRCVLITRQGQQQAWQNFQRELQKYHKMIEEYHKTREE